MKKLLDTVALSAVYFLLTASSAYAQSGTHFTSSVLAGGQNFKDFIETYILRLIYLIIPLVASLALLSFFWGLTKFIAKGGSDKSIAEGRSLMVWGIVGLFAMVSVWGIIRFLQGEVGFVHFGIPLLPSQP